VLVYSHSSSLVTNNSGGAWLLDIGYLGKNAMKPSSKKRLNQLKKEKKKVTKERKQTKNQIKNQEEQIKNRFSRERDKLAIRQGKIVMRYLKHCWDHHQKPELDSQDELMEAMDVFLTSDFERAAFGLSPINQNSQSHSE
jgi:hypothetical protein